MSGKIFRSIVLVAGVVLLASFLIIMGVLYEHFVGAGQSQARDYLSLAAAGAELGGESYLRELGSDNYRITWIAADGSVIYDSKADAREMENHAGRAEVSRALATGDGESSRYSNTLLEKTFYRAKRLSDGTVLRASISTTSAWVLVLGMLQPLIFVLVAAMILSGVLAGRLSKRIVEPLNRLNLDNPLDNDAYGELSPLLNRINRQRIEITRQIEFLRHKTDEFSQIIGSMKEGLVILDEGGRVLSINPTAEKIFSTDSSCVGCDFLNVERSRDISLAIRRAFSSGRGEARLEREGRAYHFDVSRIDSGGKSVGAVILAFDITQQEYAERNRREFTANVSHELKTPLQGIMGSAELIENGMVAPADVPRFVGHIREEAARMVALVGDIIRLSQLDEGVDMPREEVDLSQVAREVAESLHNAASQRNITMSVEGGEVKISAVRRLIYDIIYNLCDNAVKYNSPGGSVTVNISSGESSAVIAVEDSGIGIPPQDADRVFERFYRVDKSHSKASGGTGLGLSIVKHAVKYHSGHISLNSEPGKGTRVIITLPT